MLHRDTTDDVVIVPVKVGWGRDATESGGHHQRGGLPETPRGDPAIRKTVPLPEYTGHQNFRQSTGGGGGGTLQASKCGGRGSAVVKLPGS